MDYRLEQAQSLINEFKKQNPDESVGELSDTYHSFNDLYKHRTLLLALAFNYIPYAWKSRVHSDKTMFDNMFIVGCPTPDGMITYHCDNEYWALFRVPELPTAPMFDGHTSNDVLDRLTTLIQSGTSRLINPSNIQYIDFIVSKYILSTFGQDEEGKLKFLSFYKNR